jgi:phosphocarrier protein
MAERRVRLADPSLLHARTAARLVARAERYQAEIFLSRAARRVNAKSILGVLLLAAENGEWLTVQSRGRDHEQAAAELAEFIAGGFGAGGGP